MADVRLKTDTLELEGKTYTLRCNMNVLADVQEAFGGDLLEALDPKHRHRSGLEFAAAMINDWADEQGWDERWTARTLGRALPVTMPGTFTAKIMELVFDALGIGETAEEESADAENDKKKQTENLSEA